MPDGSIPDARTEDDNPFQRGPLSAIRAVLPLLPMSGLRATSEVAVVRCDPRGEASAMSIKGLLTRRKIGATYFRDTCPRARDGGPVHVPPGGEFLTPAR